MPEWKRSFGTRFHYQLLFFLTSLSVRFQPGYPQGFLDRKFLIPSDLLGHLALAASVSFWSQVRESTDW